MTRPWGLSATAPTHAPLGAATRATGQPRFEAALQHFFLDNRKGLRADAEQFDHLRFGNMAKS